eukprot:CAMPEP_0184325916 /NCGR_PEP_ID=MMETSP1049-20130417/142286_1 /TAXON_ID=77928 /ORGANISM="Proteomonas sulcata, Strain CCMP704" /LENGTH=835 /DNA_ID=CAMNT_0026648081 /DNA_START=182 /DNA_END=2689 /DNA_ORIENTATION=+
MSGSGSSREGHREIGTNVLVFVIQVGTEMVKSVPFGEVFKSLVDEIEKSLKARHVNDKLAGDALYRLQRMTEVITTTSSLPCHATVKPFQDTITAMNDLKTRVEKWCQQKYFQRIWRSIMYQAEFEDLFKRLDSCILDLILTVNVDHRVEAKNQHEQLRSDLSKQDEALRGLAKEVEEESQMVKIRLDEIRTIFSTLGNVKTSTQDVADLVRNLQRVMDMDLKQVLGEVYALRQGIFQRSVSDLDFNVMFEDCLKEAKIVDVSSLETIQISQLEQRNMLQALYGEINAMKKSLHEGQHHLESCIPNLQHGIQQLQERVNQDKDPKQQHETSEMEEISQGKLTKGDLIGQGSFSKVYSGKLLYEGRQVSVAIKVVEVSVTEGESVSESNLRNEMKWLRSLRNRSVIKYFGFTYRDRPGEPKELWEVLEMAELGDLRKVISMFKELSLRPPKVPSGAANFILSVIGGDRIEDGEDKVTSASNMIERALGGRLPGPSPAFFSLSRQIVEALVYIHNKGVAHCDIKTQNILITLDGRALLADFGISNKFKETHMSQQKISGDPKGTYSFMAPELMDQLQPNSRSDVYSAGMVLYEMLSGSVPFGGYTPLAISRAVDRGNRPTIPDHLPLKLIQLVEEMWHTDPKVRPIALDVVIKLTEARIQEDTKQNTHLPMTPQSLDQNPSTAVTPKPLGQVDAEYGTSRTKAWLEAAKAGDMAGLLALLQCFQSNNDNHQINHQDETGDSALMLAALNGHSKTAELLLKSKAEVNLQSNDGASALMLAAHNGHSETAELLLKSKAEVNLQRNTGATALDVAMSRGHGNCAQVLRGAGAQTGAELRV